MEDYKATFHTDCEYAFEYFKAESPQEALRLAIKANDGGQITDFEHRDGCVVNEIEISNDTACNLAVWRDRDLKLHLAAQELLDALRDMKSRFQSCIAGGNGELDGDKEAIQRATYLIASLA